MAEIDFSCPGCGRTYQVDASLRGKKVRCKGCNEVSRIPEPSAPLEMALPQEDLRFACPRCGYDFTLAARLAGKQARCKQCGEVFRVPGKTPAEPARAARVATPPGDDGGGYSLVGPEPQPAS